MAAIIPRNDSDPSGAYASRFSAYDVAQMEASLYDNYNPTMHYESLGTDAREMKSSFDSLLDTYITKEEALKKMEDDFCRRVGNNGLLCPRDRIRHRNNNAPIVYFQQENPSGIISDKIRTSLGMEAVEKPYQPCPRQHPDDLEGCVLGQADRFLAGSADTNCAVNLSQYNTGNMRNYTALSKTTPNRCEDMVSNIPRYSQLSASDSKKFSGELDKIVAEEMAASYGSEGFRMPLE